MTRFSFSALITVLAFVLSPGTLADYVIEYQEDFSSDPRWITDQPSNYFPEVGVFHATTPNAQTRPGPTRYAGTLVEYDGRSLNLEFDIQPVDLQWSAAVAFGFFDRNLAVDTSEDIPDSHFLYIEIGRVDPGRYVSVRVRGESGAQQLDEAFNVISEGQWYHCVLEYLGGVDSINVTVTNKDTEAPVADLEISNVGGLPDTLDFLGFARDPRGECCPDCPGYSCSNEATAQLDNVCLRVSTPCPWDISGPYGVPDDTVNTYDLLALLAAWGACP